MMIKIKYLLTATSFFLAGLIASQFLSQQHKVVYQPETIPSVVSEVDASHNINEQGLNESISLIKVMLSEQAIRLEKTEKKINDLLNLSESLIHVTNYDSTEQHIDDEPPQNDEVYQNTRYYVDAQLENGFWSVDNVREVIQMKMKLTPESRARINLKIVKAINDGTLEVEDITMPLF